MADPSSIRILARARAVMEAAEKNEKAKLLMTQPGVGPITSIGVRADDGRRVIAREVE